MIKRKNLWIVLIIFSLTLLIFTWPTLAQAPTPPTSRDALIQAIQARAQRDVELGKPAKDLEELKSYFEVEAANIGLTMVEVEEIYEAAYQAATPIKPWWDPLRSLLTWTGLFALVYMVVDKLLRDYLARFFNWIGERVYLQLAGFRPFWGLALKKYRRALVERYEQLKIPFRPGRPLAMREVYVPLRVKGAHDTDLIEAYRAVAEYKWLMIVGAPGAGKTMLLKRLALHYAESELVDFPMHPVPVLLELNRLSDSQEPLETHLARVLKDNDFPGGERFIAAGLEHGLLLLLFDGLDEVASDARGRVVRHIKDLLQAHPQVQAVITCRTAVYDDEFADLVEQHLEIAPFSDQQIQRFLSAWQPQMSPSKSVEHLLRNLRERPHIMGLARNPLLLTIIAYLYTDTPFVLPHSRTAFYDKALAVLLEQWDHTKEMPNRYTADEKRLVLQHLALVLQDHGARVGRDRRSLDLPTVLAEITEVLPSVSRKAEDARPLLDEIVERSGLLLALDGGLRYQFAHLTLQEFFVAQKLQDDAGGLLGRFQADPGAWREPVKLWCGLAHDSTGLIEQLYAHDPIMAFECLGDAQQVEAALADRMIVAFQARLGEGGAESEAVTHAFAMVATNPHKQQVFELLAATVKDATNTTRCSAAAQALAWSNLPRAAKILAECAPEYPEMRSLLTQMGDLGTPVLAEWAEQGHEWAFDALQMVGTPDAALVLTDLLWAEDKERSPQAAWRLAGLLPNPSIEATLREFPLTPEQRKAPYLEWLWEPFNEPGTSSLPVIVGRIGYWLEQSLQNSVPPELSVYEFDLRLVTPLCALTPLKLKNRLVHDKELPEELMEAANSLSPTDAESLIRIHKGNRLKAFRELLNSLIAWFEPTPAYSCTDLQRLVVFIEFLIDLANPSEALRFILQRLPPKIQLKILSSQVAYHAPTKDDWRNLYHRNEYDFVRSWHARGLKALTVLFLILAMLHIGVTLVNAPKLLSWTSGFDVLLGLCLIGGGLWLTRAHWTLDVVDAFLVFFLLGGIPAIGVVAVTIFNNWLVGVVLGVVFGVIFGMMFNPAFDVMDDKYDTNMVYGIVLGVAGGAVGGVVGSVMTGVWGCIVSGAVFIAIFGAVGGRTFGNAAFGAILGATISAIISTVIYGLSLIICNFSGPWGLSLFWVIWSVLFLSLYRQAKHRKRAAENPLHGLLPGTEPTPGVSLRQGWMSFLPQAVGFIIRRLRGKRIRDRR
jgi:hypothetical protein